MPKVRIKSTGEVLDFAPGSYVAVHRPGSPYSDDHEYPIGEVEIIADADNSYRNEFAKAAMQSLLLHGNNSDEWLAKRAFDIADSMMNQMKK